MKQSYIFDIVTICVFEINEVHDSHKLWDMYSEKTLLFSCLGYFQLNKHKGFLKELCYFYSLLGLTKVSLDHWLGVDFIFFPN